MELDIVRGRVASWKMFVRTGDVSDGTTANYMEADGNTINSIDERARG